MTLIILLDNASSCKELHILIPQLPNGYYKYNNLEVRFQDQINF